MPILTYVKGLPTPAEELNSLGLTEFEMFLAAYSPVFHKAACETANHLLTGNNFNKSSWNAHLQTTYGISKRHAGGVIAYAQGAVDASKKHLHRHIKTLEGQLKSINLWIKKSQKKLDDSVNFYAKKTFSTKKEQLREHSRKYARMLSGWAYSRFYELLESILSNRGIYLMKVNPAYTSVIGLVKYARQYGLASDEAAAMAIARRGMGLTEKIPGSITAYLSVKDGKHVWSQWNQLNNLIKKSSIKRHCFYAISNWESLVKQWSEQSAQSKRKC